MGDLPGPSFTTGVPNFVIRKFRVPVFLLPIYQAAGIQYGIRWEVLAAINEIETDYGRNLNVSSAGALGWMQFIPSSWRAYGTDANKDGKKDPYNPVDAIFAAARYLKAAGYEKDVRRSIFAYNHADWYVDSVMLRARLIAGVPADLVGSLTGLTEGRFPVAARARYAKGDRPQGRGLRPARRARGRDQRLRGPEGRRKRAAGPLPRARGRVRQPLHVLRPRRGGASLPGAQGRRRSQAARGGPPCGPVPVEARVRGPSARPERRGARAAGVAAREAAAVRQPVPPARTRGRRARAARPDGQAARLRAVLRQEGAAARSQALPPPPAEGRITGGGRHGAGARGGRGDRQGGAPGLLDPPRRARGAADRPEAHPGRLEAARGHRDLPRLGA